MNRISHGQVTLLLVVGYFLLCWATASWVTLISLVAL